MENIKVIKINFPRNTEFNTPAKRLKFVRKFGEPIRSQHKSKKYFKYLLDIPNKKNKIVRKKIDNVWLHIELI